MNYKTFLHRKKALCHLSFLKTIYINFRCLPFRQAIILPIWIGRGTVLRNLGRIKINGVPKTGYITFGIHNLFNSHNSQKTIIDNQGEIEFNGKAHFQTGVVIKTFSTGFISFGSNFALGVHSQIIARKYVKFGNYNRLSWNVYVSDTDFHFVKNIITNDVKVNTIPINFGEYCWIANGASISKGCYIPNYCIIASRSHVNKSFDEENVMLAGVPAQIKATNVRRVFNYLEECCLNEQFKLMEDS